MAITRKQAGIGSIIVAALLLIFLFYWFKMRGKKEKCPDGQDIPASGNCAENTPKKDASGSTVTGTIDAQGCTQPSSYVTNHFPIMLGMMGDLVKQLQKGLNSSFNTKLSVDGFAGCNTMEAVAKNLGVDTVDAQLFKDKILTPASVNQTAFKQTPPIVNNCDANGLDKDGFACNI